MKAMNTDSPAISIALSLQDSKLISQEKFDRVVECIKQCLARHEAYNRNRNEEWETMTIPGIDGSTP